MGFFVCLFVCLLFQGFKFRIALLVFSKVITNGLGFWFGGFIRHSVVPGYFDPVFQV